MTQQLTHPAVRYRQHHCQATHRTTTTFLRCAFKRIAWISGTGPYALIAWCGTTTITLWETHTAAADAQSALDSHGCGGRCYGKHTLALINLEGQTK